MRWKEVVDVGFPQLGGSHFGVGYLVLGSLQGAADSWKLPLLGRREGAEEQGPAVEMDTADLV